MRQLQPQEHAHHANRFRWPVIALVAALLVAIGGTYTWYSLRSSCEVEAVQDASTTLVSQLHMYDRVYQVAVTAFQTVPDHPVNTMKQIYMDTQKVVVPGCLQTAKEELINYMGTVILAFDAYRAGQADEAVADLIEQSDAQYANFNAELWAVRECAPLCIR